jgi:hypothetical protein
MRFAIDASDPRATNPDPVLLKEVKRARRRCFDALVSGRIGKGRSLPDSPPLKESCLIWWMTSLQSETEPGHKVGLSR